MGKIVTLGEVVSDIYRGEELSDVELGFVARPGGAPANVAVAASRLGSGAAFVGSVGEDLFGDFILRALESEGVDTSGVGRQSPPTRTSLAFVEIGTDGDREFTFYRSSPAADELLSPEDVTEDVLSGASFVNFGSIPLIREPVRSATHRIAELAREHDIPVAFDVNFREHLWESAEAAREAVDPLLDLSTIVKLGDDELPPLLGTDDIEEAARMLLDRGVSLVLISKGPEGAFYATREFSGEVPTFDVGDIVDATGAGDAFLAAALVHLSDEPLEEERVREASLRGCAAGALACTDYGAMRALPTNEDLEQFMEANLKRVTRSRRFAPVQGRFVNRPKPANRLYRRTLADLDGHVHQFGELAGQRPERGQFRGGVSRVYHGQAERLCQERVVVVDVPRHVGVGSRGAPLPG